MKLDTAELWHEKESTYSIQTSVTAVLYRSDAHLQRCKVVMFVDAKQLQAIYCLQVLMNEGIDRRRRFIATVACSLGIGVIINPGWATDNLWVATSTMPSGVRAVRYTILSPNTVFCSCRVLPVAHSDNCNVDCTLHFSCHHLHGWAL